MSSRSFLENQSRKAGPAGELVLGVEILLRSPKHLGGSFFDTFAAVMVKGDWAVQGLFCKLVDEPDANEQGNEEEDHNDFVLRPFPPTTLLGVVRHLGMICKGVDTAVKPSIGDLLDTLRENALGITSLLPISFLRILDAEVHLRLQYCTEFAFQAAGGPNVCPGSIAPLKFCLHTLEVIDTTLPGSARFSN
ncbi:hypothetical protein R1flu_013794 [Riccia fluitans]|uniref:Uncharacterized protein n=1 Tax=Riccia fluitans TaxID=41844 RepID=A0ABD1YEM0_9MARC